MLPKLIYEMLPYLYLSMAIVGSVMMHSTIVYMAALIFMMTGLLVLTMRFTYRREIRRLYRRHLQRY